MSRGYIGNLLQAEDPLTSSGVLDANERYVQLVTPKTQSVATRNILNGVLNCAWDKTSYSPKLLEIYENSQVKFNIDSDNPLVLAFANGWDDLDRPAQVVKRLAVAPANIDLSAKANCHVQIVAKVINDELVITTHDIYDPAFAGFSDIVPIFPIEGVADGWTITASAQDPGYECYKAHNGNNWDMWKTSDQSINYLYLTPPVPISIFQMGVIGYGTTFTLWGRNLVTDDWANLGEVATIANGTMYSTVLTSPASLLPYAFYRFSSPSSGTYMRMYAFKLFERPLVKFFRGLNKVKDRAGAEVYWINLGYATVDASGNITALNHYTDLRNNYPGGMRVEA